MSETCYTVGKARRFVAGDLWCAQAKNAGKMPCLRCRGRGTIPASGVIRIGCPDCKVTGHCDPEIFFLWMVLWVQLDLKGLVIDDKILHG